MPVLIHTIVSLYGEHKTNNIPILSFQNFSIILVKLFVFLALLLPNNSFARKTDSPRVLVLNSYHHGYEWSDNVMKGISSVLDKADPTVEVWYEFLDTKRHDPADIFPMLVDLLKEKHNHHPFDLLIVNDNNAFSFILSFRKQLFQNVPVVFCGVNNFHDSLLDTQQKITGVAEELDLKGTIELALKLHPNTQYIASVSGVTKTSKIVLEKLRAVKKHFDQSITFIELAELNSYELANKLQELPENTIILHLTYFLDKRGRNYSLDESVQIIKSHSSLPIYTTWDFLVRKGVVGGIVTSGYLQGENAAKLALEILNGKSADSIPVIKKSPNVPMFDYHELQRFNIDGDALPEGSILLDEPKSFYYQYKRLVWPVVAFLFLQMAIIVLLTISIKKRRAAEIKLSQYHEQLEKIVKNRTESLTTINEQLEKEIDERLQAEEEIKMSNAELDQIFNTVTDGMRVINKEYEVIKVNKTFLNLIGLGEEDIVGRKCYEIFPGPQCDTHECPLHKVVGGAEKVESEVLKERPDGKKIPCIVTATPFHDTRGNLLGMIEVFKDITLRKKLEKRLFELSITDELTSLLNRRGFIEMSDKQLSLADRTSGDLFLLYADIDNMKWINDNLGHAFGDKALAEAAHLLLSTFRDSDIFGRLGGDEFAVLLTGSPSMNSEKSIMKRLEKSIAAVNRRKDRQYELSISAGIVRHDHKKPLIIDELMEKADELMYEAKKMKKNNPILCETCNSVLKEDQELIFRKCAECKAEEESCGCSDE